MLATAGALLGLSFVLYARSLWFGFVSYDDGTVLLSHPNLYDERSLWRSLQQIFVGYFPREEPLLVRDLSWAIDARLFGFTNPFGYHLGNVLLNAVNTALLYLFLREATRREALAVMVAALWAVVPVHVEPVCWVMGRKDVLSAFFVLLVLLLEARAEHAPDARRRRLLRLGALALYPLAVLAKFAAVSLVLVLAAYRALAPALDGRAPPGTPWSWRRAASAAAALWPHLLISVAVYLWYQRILSQWGVIGGVGPPALSALHLATLARFVPLVVGLYVESLVGFSNHSISYMWPNVAIPLTAGEQVVSAMIALAAAGGLAWAALRRRDLLFHGLAFLGFMLPYFNISYIGIWRADRYVYLSSFCLLAIAVQAGMGLVARAAGGARERLVRASAAGVAAALALVAAGGTLVRQAAFRDNHALWTHEVGVARPSMLAFQALAKSFFARARDAPDPAVRAHLLGEAERTVAAGLAYHATIPWRDPGPYNVSATLDYANLHTLRGRMAALRGEPLEAQIAHYRRAYAAAPTRANSLLLAQTLFQLAARRRDGALARESLRHYEEYVLNVKGDPIKRAEVARVLERDYRGAFPGLKEEIDAVIRRHLR